MTIEEKQKLIASKVHESVLTELNENSQFKQEALKSYFEKHQVDGDVSEYCLIPKNTLGGDSVTIEDNQFEVEEYTFAFTAFNYVNRPRNESTGLIPKVSITTFSIEGTFEMTSESEIELTLSTEKLVCNYDISDRVEIIVKR